MCSWYKGFELCIMNLKMKFLIAVLHILVLFSPAFGQGKIEGIYRSNFATNGFLIETLSLNCDSSFVLNFKGDLINRSTYGKWYVNNKRLILVNDSIQSFSFGLTTKKLHDTNTKYIKAKILLQMSKADFEKIEKTRDEVYKETGNKIELPKYNYASTNRYGAQKKYCLKRTKKIDCN